MDETLSAIHKLLVRDLNRLKDQVKSYENEKDLWIVSGGISNSAGNLCLHICGNLQHFVGAILGNSGYIRKRDDEFNLKNVPKTELLDEIETTKQVVKTTLENFDDKSLSVEYPIQVFDHPMTNVFFLVHLSGHLNYHLGQINYHRRLLS